METIPYLYIIPLAWPRPREAIIDQHSPTFPSLSVCVLSPQFSRYACYELPSRAVGTTSAPLYVPYLSFALEHCLAYSIHIYNLPCLTQNRYWINSTTESQTFIPPFRACSPPTVERFTTAYLPSLLFILITSLPSNSHARTIGLPYSALAR